MEIITGGEYFSHENIKKRQLETPFGQIVWLFRGKEVGRDTLMEKSFGEERRELAFINGVTEYDNFLFLDKNGKIECEGNSFTLEGEKMGSLCGRQYQELLKSKKQNK